MCNWERFEGLSEEQRDALLTKGLKIEVSRGYNHGWSSVRMTLDDMECWHRVSYIGRSTGEFMYHVFFLGPDEELGFTFAREGTPATWYLKRHDDLVYVRTPFSEHGFYLRWKDFVSQITEGWVSNGRLVGTTCASPRGSYGGTPWWRDPFREPINLRRTFRRTIDWDQIDTSILTDGYRMFAEHEDEVEIDLTPLAPAHLHDAYGMFSACRSLRSVDLSVLDTSQVKSMGCMFAECLALERLDFGLLDLSSVQNLYRTFYRCESLHAADLSGKQAPLAMTMRRMFELSGVRAASLRDLCIPRVTRLDELFCDCPRLERVDLRGMRADSATMLRDMFGRCWKLTEVLVDGLWLPSALDARHLFECCASLEEIDLAGMVAPKLEDLDYLFGSCSRLERVRLAGLGGARPHSLRGMFENCESLVEVDLASVDLSRAQMLRDLFSGCGSLERVDLGGCDFSSVINLRGMFRGCSSLREVDLCGLETGSLMTMRDLFSGCSGLERVGLAGLDVRQVVTTRNLFRGCAVLEEVDLTGWDAASLTTAEGMFVGCVGLRRWKASATWPVDLAGAVPEPANERGMWWSEQEGGWLSVEQIRARGPVDDTYTLEEPREGSAGEAREARLRERELYRELGGLTRDRSRWEESIPYVSSLLAHESVKIQAKALWLLGEMGLAHPPLIRDVVPAIAPFLDSPVSLLRERALNALGRIGRGDYQAIEPYWESMFRLARDEEGRVRLSFIWASENIATNTPDIYEGHMKVFTWLSGDLDDRVRMEAMEFFRVVGKRRPELVVPHLPALRIRATLDPNRVVKAHALGAIKAVE